MPLALDIRRYLPDQRISRIIPFSVGILPVEWVIKPQDGFNAVLKVVYGDLFKKSITLGARASFDIVSFILS